jgi:hypothetical protein
MSVWLELHVGFDVSIHRRAGRPSLIRKVLDRESWRERSVRMWHAKGGLWITADESDSTRQRGRIARRDIVWPATNDVGCSSHRYVPNGRAQ